MNRAQATQELFRLRAVFAGQERNLDERLLAGRDEEFLALFSTWNAALGHEAITRLIQTCRFFPVIAEAKQLYDEMNEPRPERTLARQQMLPPPGETSATREEIASTLAHVKSVLGDWNASSRERATPAQE